MEHLLQKSKCSIFHNIFKYIFQRHQKALLWSKGLTKLRKHSGPAGGDETTSSFGNMLDEFEWPSLGARSYWSSLLLFHKIRCGAVLLE